MKDVDMEIAIVDVDVPDMVKQENTWTVLCLDCKKRKRENFMYLYVSHDLNV